MRADLEASLSDAGYRVFGYVPERLAPPSIIVTGADPYLTQGETFGAYEINLAVYLTVECGTSQREIAALDEMLNAVLPHFEGSGDSPWTTEVAQPIYFEIEKSVYLGCRIAASNQFYMTGA
jgi:hypothetical protein